MQKKTTKKNKQNNSISKYMVHKHNNVFVNIIIVKYNTILMW